MSEEKWRGGKPFHSPQQRYPHTDFSSQNPYWIYEQIGVYKHWLDSLTELMTVIANTETADADEIVIELENFSDKVQQLFDSIGNYIEDLNEYIQEYLEANQDFIKEMNLFIQSLASALDDLLESLYVFFERIVNTLYEIEEKINSLEERIDYLEERIKNLEDSILDIEQRLNGLEQSIADIYQEISKIYEILDGLFSDNFQTLTEGVDYEIIYCNGFQPYTDDCSPDVMYQENKTGSTVYYKIRVQCHTEGEENAITNSRAYTPTNENDSAFFQFRHGTSWRNCSQSWIMVIQFKGEYAFLNDCSNISYDNVGGENVWNTRPISARATWAVSLAAGMVDNISNDGRFSLGNGLNINGTYIADGFNQQYWYYPVEGYCGDDKYLTFQNLNINIEVTLKP